MVATLPLAKTGCQAFLCWQEMDMDFTVRDHRLMASRSKSGRIPAPKSPVKPTRKRPQEATEPLFIGQWLRVLNLRQIELVRATGINEGYISELISGRKDNPSGAKLRLISDFMGIPMQCLFEPPPTPELVKQATKIDPVVLARLRAASGQ
jgi:hypothetical protein